MIQRRPRRTTNSLREPCLGRDLKTQNPRRLFKDTRALSKRRISSHRRNKTTGMTAERGSIGILFTEIYGLRNNIR